MAGASLLSLLDDIASILDDVSVLTKVAAKKTAGVLGDDLALNAQQVTGVPTDRELPVVWAVFKGSALNKLILVPAALAISAIAPWLVTPLLMAGGLFLCYEGAEKLLHAMGGGHGHAPADAVPQAAADAAAARLKALSEVDPLVAEKDKIRGAVRTDLILSAEIIAITLGTVAASPLPTQIAVLVGIAALMTVGVYGLVAGIVKLDDAGLYLSRRAGAGPGARVARSIGFGILTAAPYLMKSLSIVGTAAMFLVGGGILTHGIPALHHLIEDLAARAGTVGGLGGALAAAIPLLADAVVGIAAGALTVAAMTLVRRLLGRA